MQLEIQQFSRIRMPFKVVNIHDFRHKTRLCFKYESFQFIKSIADRKICKSVWMTGRNLKWSEFGFTYAYFGFFLDQRFSLALQQNH